MARHGTILGALALLVGCSSSSITDVDGGTAGDGALPVACGEPDRVCPPELPFTGAPCEGTLDCPYDTYVARCATTGEWTVEPLCDGIPIGGGCVAPLVESCDVPFDGALSGATVTIGPAGETRAFTDGELVNVEHGAQGLSMIRWALHVDGSATSPDCVRARVSFTYEGTPSPEVAQPMALHCGDTYGTLNVLPDRPCEAREYALIMQVDVDGIGSATANLRLMGALCPR